MHQVASGSGTDQYRNTRTQKIIIVAITLFALAGLMMGFAVGAITRPPRQVSITPTPPPPTALAQKPTPTATPAPTLTVADLGIGCPTVTANTGVQLADGNTDYTVSAEIVDKSIIKTTLCGKGKDLHAPDLTCKVWLTKSDDALHKLTRDQFNPVSNLQNPFPQEEQNALTFDTGQQVQPCSQTGPTAWTYKLSPSLKPGFYYVAVVADWKGIVFNWSWTTIRVKAAQTQNGQ